MPKVDSAHLTEQQKKWLASVRSNLEKETGKSLAEWVAIAKTCPETKHRARLAWFKETHGLLQNRASYVLGEAFPPEVGWDMPDQLKDVLWTDPASRAIFAAVEKIGSGLARCGDRPAQRLFRLVAQLSVRCRAAFEGRQGAVGVGRGRPRPTRRWSLRRITRVGRNG